jgi:hypothetical protein
MISRESRYLARQCRFLFWSVVSVTYKNGKMKRLKAQRKDLVSFDLPPQPGPPQGNPASKVGLLVWHHSQSVANSKPYLFLYDKKRYTKPINQEIICAQMVKFCHFSA